MFREAPRRGWALVAHTLAAVGAALAAGSGMMFLALVAYGFLIDEAFASEFFASGWDAILRVAVAVTALVIVGALGIWALFRGLARLAAVEQLARDAEEDLTSIPGWSTRQLIELKSPFDALSGFALVFLVLDGVGVLIVALALGETARYNPESAAEGLGVLVGLIALGGLTVLALVVRRRSWQPRFDRAAESVRTAWRGRLGKATAADTARRNRREPVPLPAPGASRALEKASGLGFRLGGPLLALATAVSITTLFLRQPCRYCDENSYDDAGEAALDVLAQVSAVALAVATIVLVLAAIAGWLAQAVVVAHLARRADTPGSPTPDEASLAPAFGATWPPEEAGLALVAVGGGVLPLAITASQVGGFDVAATVAVAAGAAGILGVVLLALAEPHAARARTWMRDAWAPGDIRPAVPPKHGGRRSRRS